MIDTKIESLARDLCDTYYLTVDPENIMVDAFAKITETTRNHWRAQAELLIQRGWTDGNPRHTGKATRTRNGPKSRW